MFNSNNTDISVDKPQADDALHQSLQAVNKMHPSVIYRFLQEKSPEMCLQLLPLLSEEQFVRLFDYDVWSKDRLLPSVAISWLNLYRQISADELCKRFRSLDEEYQLALLSPLISLVTAEELEKLPVNEQDEYIPLPCQQLYYRVVSEQKEIKESLPLFIEIIISKDINYAYSLLHHAHAALADEQEALILQFRTARIEEDGYVSFAESSKIYFAVDLEHYLQKWHQESSLDLQANTNVDFLAQVLTHAHQQKVYHEEQWQEVQLKLVMCANTLCAVHLVEANDRRANKEILTQVRATVGLALDYLSSGNHTYATSILLAEYAQVLFRLGMTLLYRGQQRLLGSMQDCSLPAVERFEKIYASKKWQVLADFIDVNYLDLLGFEQTELLKTIFSPFPQIIYEGRLYQMNCIANYQRYLAQVEFLADSIFPACTKTTEKQT